MQRTQKLMREGEIRKKTFFQGQNSIQPTLLQFIFTTACVLFLNIILAIEEGHFFFLHTNTNIAGGTAAVTIVA